MTDKRQFWLDLWEQNQTRWHQENINPHLDTFLLPMLPTSQQTVFVPLCGKTSDMTWLVENGHRVIGVELSELAVKTYFESNDIPFRRVEKDASLLYQSRDVTIVVGDFFDLGQDLLRDVTFVYDRAALVALDRPTRGQYSSTLQRILPGGFQVLLLTIEYSGALTGPPFSVSAAEIQQLFPAPLKVTTLLETELAVPGSRFSEQGVVSMVERVSWISGNQ